MLAVGVSAGVATALVAAGTLSAFADVARGVRVSVAGNGAQGDGESGSPAVNADGRIVAFASVAPNLVAADSNGTTDVFVHDTVDRATTLVSVATDGRQGNDRSTSPAVSTSGRYVAFTSAATNLVAGDTNRSRDVFVRDLVTGTTVLASVSGTGEPGDGHSTRPSISADGRYVAFRSEAGNFIAGGTGGRSRVFVRDLVAGRTTLVTEAASGQPGYGDGLFSPAALARPEISADGRYVTFESEAGDLVGDDTNGRSDVFVRDLAAGATSRVSVSSSGRQTSGASDKPSISADGRYIAFRSTAQDLLDGDPQLWSQIYLHDRDTGRTELVSRSGSNDPAARDCDLPALSGNGRYLAFTSRATNLVDGDADSRPDLFVRDLVKGTVVRVTASAAGGQLDGNPVLNVAISGAGRHVAYDSRAANIVEPDTNAAGDVFLHNLDG
ncbi:hypothetical protein Are01nite_21940 [Actinoplanes regularis]|nr:hypothetical protein Are01nite_21940 [Actinoplanes regularis]